MTLRLRGSWSHGGRVRVRMGPGHPILLHDWGSPALSDGHVGLDVSRGPVHGRTLSSSLASTHWVPGAPLPSVVTIQDVSINCLVFPGPQLENPCCTGGGGRLSPVLLHKGHVFRHLQGAQGHSLPEGQPLQLLGHGLGLPPSSPGGCHQLCALG